MIEIIKTEISTYLEEIKINNLEQKDNIEEVKLLTEEKDEPTLTETLSNLREKVFSIYLQKIRGVDTEHIAQ